MKNKSHDVHILAADKKCVKLNFTWRYVVCLTNFGNLLKNEKKKKIAVEFSRSIVMTFNRKSKYRFDAHEMSF